jgi:hypothetical protein
VSGVTLCGAWHEAGCHLLEQDLRCARRPVGLCAQGSAADTLTSVAADYGLQLKVKLRGVLRGQSAALRRGGPMLALYLACHVAAMYIFEDM